MAHTRECAAGVDQLRALLDSAVASPPASLSPEAAHALEAQLYDALVRAGTPIQVAQRAPPAEQLQVLEPAVVQHKLVFWLAKLATFGWQQMPAAYSLRSADTCLGVLLRRIEKINRGVAAPPPAGTPAVVAEVIQQLTESGFLKALPAMLRRAADELQELDAASTQHDGSGGDRGGGAAAAAASGTSPLTPSQERRRRRQQLQRQPRQPLLIFRDGLAIGSSQQLVSAKALLESFQAFVMLQPAGLWSSRPAPAAALGSLARLVVVTVQHASRLLAAAEGTRSTAAAVPLDVFDTMIIASICWGRVLQVFQLLIGAPALPAGRATPAAAPAVHPRAALLQAMQHVLVVPEFVQASLLVLTVAVTTAPAAGSGSSSRSSAQRRMQPRPGKDSYVVCKELWLQQLQQEQQQSGGLPVPPPLVQQLVPPVLGISAQVVALLAGTHQAMLDPSAVAAFAGADAAAAMGALQLAAAARMAQLRGVPIDQQQLGDADSQLLLASVLVLQWARHERRAAGGNAGSVAQLLGDCGTLVRHWVLLTEVQELQQRYSSGERSYKAMVLASYFSESAVVSRVLPASFVGQELLPTAMQELRCAWHELDAAMVQLSSSSSTANMDFGGSGLSTPISRATRLAVHATGLLSQAAQQDAARYGDDTESDALTVWAPHAPELAALVQGITRQLARLLQAVPAATGQPAGTTRECAEKDAVAWTVAAALENVQLCCCAGLWFQACSMREVDVQELGSKPFQEHHDEALYALGPLAAAAAAEAMGVSGSGGSSSGGYGSATQQLFGLLCSTLKMQALLQDALGSSHPRQQLCSPVRAVFRCTCYMLKAQLLAPQPAGADALLPWLVLMGRCCLMWAQELQQLLAPDAATHLPLCRFCYVRHTSLASSCSQAQAAASKAAAERGNSVAPVLDQPPSGGAAVAGSLLRLNQPCLSGAVDSLLQLMPAAAAETTDAPAPDDAAASMEEQAGQKTRWSPVYWRKLTQSQQQQLAAAVDQVLGSATQLRIWQQLPALDKAVAESELFFSVVATAAYGVHDPRVTFFIPDQDRLVQDKGGRLIEALTQLGTALASLPLSQACSNPACVNMAGHSEQRLVGGPKTVCGGCCRVRYCSRACQVQHWAAGHKAVCKQLREAAAAAGVTAAAAAAADAPAAAAAVSEGAAAAGGRASG